MYPTEEFIGTMIQNNKADKRAKEPLVLEDGSVLVEPIRSDFESSGDYQKAKRKYDVAKGKSLFETR